MACLDLLGECDMMPPTAGAFARLVGRDSDSGSLSLIADRVSVLEACGVLDCTTFLTDEHKQMITDPSALFPQGVADLSRRCKFSAGAQAEYVHLLIRQLRSRKVGLAIKPKSVSKTFPVGKRDPNAQREVWVAVNCLRPQPGRQSRSY